MTASRFESLTGHVGLAFPAYDAPPADPVTLLTEWLTAAVERGVREPRAMTLATADRRGRASTRIVVLIEVDARGLVFATHTTSRKGREIAETGWASGLFYWRETGQQVIVGGPVHLLPSEESDSIWFRRPVPLHSMSTASCQSDPLDDPAALLDKADRLDIGVPLPRPPKFAGYQLVPEEVEFWAASPNRLHLRLRYDLDGRVWRTRRLQP
jgi:pyridoxamine-phosphate oxidase